MSTCKYCPGKNGCHDDNCPTSLGNATIVRCYDNNNKKYELAAIVVNQMGYSDGLAGKKQNFPDCSIYRLGWLKGTSECEFEEGNC